MDPRRSVAPLLAAVGLLAGAAAGCSSGERPTRAPRGALVYVVDTLRADHLSAYGYHRPTSPRLDAFAERSVLFEDCVSQSSWTKPSTASILTGLYPAEHGADTPQHRMEEGITTLAERLATHGVRTGGFYANSWLSPKHGLHQGFETFEFVPRETPALTRTIVDRALAFVRDPDPRPFFCYVHVIDPHAPYEPPPPYDALFGGGYEGDVGGDYGLDDPEQRMELLTPEDTQRLIDLYDGTIAHTDAEFGRLVDELERDGLLADTLVLFTSDHGEEFHDHQSWRHNGQLYQEVVHVPLIVHFPGLARAHVGARHAGLTQQVDVAPTVLAAFGLPRPAELAGNDLRLLVEQGGPSGDAFGIIEVDNAGMYRKAVVAGRTKYIRAWAPAEREFLYDLAADPLERDNLIERAPERADHHRAILERFVARTGRGVYLLFQNGGDELLEAEILIFADVDHPRVTTIYSEETKRKGELRDGRVARDDVHWEGRLRKGTRIIFKVEPADGDGLQIEPAPGERALELHARIDGAFVEPGHVRLGAGGRIPDALPVRVDLARWSDWQAPIFPARSDLEGAPYRMRVWTSPGPDPAPELEFTPEEIEAFRALGYLGDE